MFSVKIKRVEAPLSIMATELIDGGSEAKAVPVYTKVETAFNVARISSSASCGSATPRTSFWRHRDERRSNAS